MKRWITITLTIIILIGIVLMLRGCQNDKNKRTFTLSPTVTKVTAMDNVVIDVGSYVIDKEMELTVEKYPLEVNKIDKYQLQAYDLQIEGMTSLRDFITIRIPYDSAYLEEGVDPIKCIGAKLKDGINSNWEDVLFEVDTTAKELVIYTDRLATIGIVYYEDALSKDAYIPNIYYCIQDIDKDEAMVALSQIVTQKDEQVDGIAKVGAVVADELCHFAQNTKEYVTDDEGILQIASLNGDAYHSLLSRKAYVTLVDLGKVSATMKMSSVYFGSEFTEEEIAPLYRYAVNVLMNNSETSQLARTMSALTTYDTIFQSFTMEGEIEKQPGFGALYDYYNNNYKNDTYEARSLMDWRNVILNIVEANPCDVEKAKLAIEKDIDMYARSFWMTTPEVKQEIAKTLQINYEELIYPTDEEIEDYIAYYKTNLYKKLYPVNLSMRNYLMKKVESNYQKQLAKAWNFYNQQIVLTICEEPEDKVIEYAGYTASLYPLSETAIRGDWTKKLNPSGRAVMTFTIMDYITAGSPAEIHLLKQGESVEIVQPEKIIKLRITTPETKVDINKTGGTMIYKSCNPINYLIKNALTTYFKEEAYISVDEAGNFKLTCPSFDYDKSESDENVETGTITNLILEGKIDKPGKEEGSVTFSFDLDTHEFELEKLQGNDYYSENLKTADSTITFVGKGYTQYDSEKNEIRLNMHIDFNVEKLYSNETIKTDFYGNKTTAVNGPFTDKDHEAWDEFTLVFTANL